MLREVKPDPARTHFLGRVPYDSYRKVLQVFAAHVYLTYPFILSWSMLEAMASGCLVRVRRVQRKPGRLTAKPAQGLQVEDQGDFEF